MAPRPRQKYCAENCITDGVPGQAASTVAKKVDFVIQLGRVNKAYSYYASEQATALTIGVRTRFRALLLLTSVVKRL